MKTNLPIDLQINACAFARATDTRRHGNKISNLRFQMLNCAALLAFLFLGGNALAAEPPAEKPKPPATLQDLQRRIGAIVANPKYAAALWGVKIASLDSGRVLVSVNEQKLFSPASNSKLYTMALGMDHLGPDYRIKTSLYALSRPDANGMLNGDLIIYGRGDPTINNPDIYKAVEPLIAILTNAGVKQITGDIIGDDSFFHSAPFGSGWDWGDFENYYGAEISALTINSNLLQIAVKPGETAGAPAQASFVQTTPYMVISNRMRTVAKGEQYDVQLSRPVAENVVYLTGTVPLEHPQAIEETTVHDMAGLFAAVFKDALAQHGITVGGRARAMHYLDREVAPLNLSECVELGHVESLPFREIIRAVEKPSQNLYTDLVLEHMGANMLDGKSEASGEQAGIRELNQFLQKVGIPRGQTIFEEGSGLSRDNLTSPFATVKLLTYMSHQSNAAVYIDALPIAGVDGTLRHRMRGTPAQNNVRAKTGTLRWANSLSGYVTSAAGEHLVFSLMLNRYQGGSKTEDLDAIAELLASFTGRTP
ncbi:MAG TPA: D-alanyl-D-alanine carboxypeptidase/D-alanyl-D-alanine-endopeptidase [Verrucomicrobiae bacterium]|nr:D-alanyl-D-alanine carboxypeptidase/D-alanyl-D-alanine-endopeptidase [Verrucomicrobiae bacterium]